MMERSLQITYRKGRPFAAHLHLSHETGERSARTVPSADGLLVVDYAANGQAIGVEITAPTAVSLDPRKEPGTMKQTRFPPWAPARIVSS